MCIKTPESILATVVTVLLLASPIAYSAQQGGPVQLTSIAEVEVIETDAAGEQHIKRRPADKVVPGKDVIYTLSFENVGTEPGDDIVIQNPIPEHTVYKTDSAAGKDTRISFSVDGGRSFSLPDQLMVKEADGSTRVAKASEYTTIRWQYTKSLQPGSKSSVEFRVLLQ